MGVVVRAADTFADARRYQMGAEWRLATTDFPLACSLSPILLQRNLLDALSLEPEASAERLRELFVRSQIEKCDARP